MAGAPVEVSGVWKRFHRGRRADTLRELGPALLRSIVGRRARDDDNAFWALRDVSFTVSPGEVLGIIGPNGAGKSTMLGVLAGILWPDRGSVAISGRIGALIELAAGFHPDLTGRENVYLQGAIMGMKRVEIARRFDEIVEFAGFAEFIDTPIKHYSSGMNARLGFSIAAHLEPDVLLIDEVLAVGDRAFQRKAFDFLGAIVQRGVPVVVVSHQLDRVATLCNRAILLSQGQVRFDGPAAQCVARYIEGGHLVGPEADDCPVDLTGARVDDGDVEREPGDPLVLHVAGCARRDVPERLSLGVRVWTLPSEDVVAIVHAPASSLGLREGGDFEIEVELALNLGPGTYRLQAVVLDLATRREWVRGPSALIAVASREGSAGSAWLDPRIRRRDA